MWDQLKNLNSHNKSISDGILCQQCSEEGHSCSHAGNEGQIEF